MFDERRTTSQPFFVYNPDASHPRNAWRTARPLVPAALRASASTADGPAFSRLQLFSWNIDFSCSESEARMRTALAHMRPMIEALDEADAVVIFFQEMTKSTLHVIHETDWVCERFYSTDRVASSWISTYGTITLVDRRLVVAPGGVRRLRLRSEFGRDGLFVDLLMLPSGGGGGGSSDGMQQQQPQQEQAQEQAQQPQHKVLRLCNVHLDSMSSNPPVRPTQFAMLAPLLQPSDTVQAAIMGGDTNANQRYDVDLPAANNLGDTYLALGGVEGAVDGHTWGYQSAYTRFSPARLDKLLFAGAVRPTRLQRFGVGVLVDDVGARTRLEDIGEEEFVTDHYGLWGTYELEGGMALARGRDAWTLSALPNGHA